MVALFQPLKIKDVTFRNRIAVSPMCQYSSDDGHPNDWHLVHLGSRAVGGAGLVMVEATAVSPEGRISPGDSGIYSDEHVAGFSRIAKFVSEMGAIPGIQIAHAGRKASAAKPWEGDDHLSLDQGGWEIVGPSAEAFGANLPRTPKELTKTEIQQVTSSFVTAARRALDAGFQTLQLHFAHGYLAHSFYSPLSNKRTDEYGGSFDNRTRFLRETFTAVREVWPERFPLMVRLSVTDWIAGGVTVEESIALSQWLQGAGLDMLDVSMGFATPDISQIPWSPGFMLPIAAEIRKATRLPTSVGWMITDPAQANSAVESGQTDVVMLAREMLRDPYWPFHAARALGVEHPQGILPTQYAHFLKR
ncbi:MAG: NADH:flavin oxidoreductase/NADH oxidase [Planctomycetaceae bacterium]|nr:NADH:flavin oxidoreductase/NADH oxidase [Planctomycetaceae bacterium]